MDRNKQKAEAIERMKMLNLMDGVIEEFKDKDILELSERMNAMFDACLYWTTNDTYPGLTEEIKKFEKESKSLVYHVQLTHLEFGDCYAFLYVSPYEEEWETDREDIRLGQPLVYVWNASDPLMSEYGSIGIKPSMGGVARIW